MRELKFRELLPNGKFHYWGMVEEGLFKGPASPSVTRAKHGQYTGLKDRNGNEIYEGDKLLDSSGVTWVAVWNDDHACFGVYALNSPNVGSDIIDNLNMTVNGNIYE